MITASKLECTLANGEQTEDKTEIPLLHILLKIK